MLPRSDLTGFARAAAAMLAREPDLAQFELYCASAEHRIARLNYTSDIPCRGVEEFKSLAADGFQVRIAMRRDLHETGTAFAAADLSLDALRAALGRARSAAVVDPHFPGFPREPRKLVAAGRREKHDLLKVRDSAIASAGARILEGALAAFRRSDAAQLPHPGLVIGGDVSVIRDRIALASSHFADLRTDESAHFSASVTALVESLDGKGTAATLGASADRMRRESAILGRAAVMRALALKDGARPPSGTYRVVFGPQPVAEILNYMVMGSLTTGAFHAASSAYQGRFGDRVMDARLSLADDPAYRAGAIHRRITCEGIPARRVDLIRHGRLIGLLSDYYDSHRLLTDEHRAEKLGPAAPAAPEFASLGGYRLGEGGGRRYDAGPGASGTNVVLRARGGIGDRELVRAVGDGIYVGRVWYTYPINGQRAGDFTCTITGDSYLIRNGEIAQPLAPNALRVNANIAQVFDSVIAAGGRALPAVIWSAPEAYYVPAIATDGIALAEVGAPL